MKELKRLILKKEVINRLNDNQMNNLQGGGNFCPPNGIYDCTKHCPPSTYISDCPYLSIVGSGCDAETCGWAPTCNGR